MVRRIDFPESAARGVPRCLMGHIPPTYKGGGASSEAWYYLAAHPPSKEGRTAGTVGTSLRRAPEFSPHPETQG